MHSWQPAAIPEAELLLPPSPRSPTSPAKVRGHASQPVPVHLPEARQPEHTQDVGI